MFTEPRMLSRPVGVEWAGWRSDTLTLQRAGWELAVEFEYYRHQYRLLMRHKMLRLYAVTDMLTLENVMSDRFGMNTADMPVFHVIGVAPSIQSLQVQGISFAAFREIDATPRFSESRITRVEDLNIFAAPMPGAKGEVLIDGADMSVIEHLEAIKRLQSKTQEEIRQRILDQRHEGSDISKHESATNKVVALVNYSRAA
jgi:hypothetical protein